MTLHIIRAVLTAISAGLTSALVYYPNQYWIPAVVASIAAVGYYVVPSVTQVTPVSNLHYPGIQQQPDEPTNPLKGQ